VIPDVLQPQRVSRTEPLKRPSDCFFQGVRSSILLTAIIGVVGLTSCTRDRRDEPAARQVGREAYDATQEIKRGAKKAAREVRDAGKEIRQGWKEAKRDAPPPQRRDEPR